MMAYYAIEKNLERRFNAQLGKSAPKPSTRRMQTNHSYVVGNLRHAIARLLITAGGKLEGNRHTEATSQY